ncbi:methylated-DNA--[protein]-cysteine S-methyltransferase [Bacillus sp. CGMCC 1.16541]|uniref:methylated-DNA--[protein]-cysteine S-methyltransferase n=1 Tax=Bacillus sp. CGMCC 1.16541 TaxID=2185143 RepID=UPI00194DC0F0|nr:methylated-DNA--[protein]-cysteine S-methyltransferase [Bacillus sp. CGMCC 1.16541]
MITIQWGVLKTDEITVYLAKTEKGLCYVGSPGEDVEACMTAVKKRFLGAVFEENESALQPYIKELQQYISGQRKTFSLSVDVNGTAFQEEVWLALMDIPYGETCAYSDIAEKIGRPSSVRAVGAAIGANPVMIAIPCHRVIGKSGKITGYRGGLDMKRMLLQLEGIYYVEE